ncbi:Hydroxypyruvate reductase [subsurface metagenome]
MKILITPRSFASISKTPMEMLEEKGYEIIKNETGKSLNNKDMSVLIEDVDGIIIGIDDLNAGIIKHACNLKVISKYGVGVDNIDIKAATTQGIVVTNTPKANIDAVADLTFALMLALARRIPEADRETKAGNWKKFIGTSVWRKKLGVIGLGKIGRQVVKRARGFEMEILCYDIIQDEEFARQFGVRYVDLETLLKESDYITIHTPLNDVTRDMIGYKELEMINENAFLINTSRGGIIDEKALYDILKNNKIKGAALDSYKEEPPENSFFVELENIIMTSHNGAYTKEAINNMGIQAAQNLIDVLEGREPENRIN